MKYKCNKCDRIFEEEDAEREKGKVFCVICGSDNMSFIRNKYIAVTDRVLCIADANDLYEFKQKVKENLEMDNITMSDISYTIYKIDIFFEPVQC